MSTITNNYLNEGKRKRKMLDCLKRNATLETLIYGYWTTKKRLFAIIGVEQYNTPGLTS